MEKTLLPKKTTKSTTLKQSIDKVKLVAPVKKKLAPKKKKEEFTGLTTVPVKRKKPSVAVYTANPSFKEVRKEVQAEIKNIEAVISHGSRTQACVNACDEIIKKGGVVLNHPDYIRVASDKYLCKQVMKKGEIDTTPFQLVSEPLKLKFPIVAKLRKGSGGKGMYLLNNEEDLEKFKTTEKAKLNLYFLEEMFNPRKEFNNHVKTTKEFRIHFSNVLMGIRVDYVDEIKVEGKETTKEKHYSNNGVIFITKKLSKPDEEGNFKFGKNITAGNAYFVRDLGKVDENLMDYAIQDVCSLLNILELDYAAVDVQICEETKKWNILEVNTAPGFGEGEGITAGRYKTALVEIIKQKNKICAELARS